MNRTLLCLAAAWLCLSSHEVWAQTDEEIAQASVENPLDMTFKLVNPSFDNGDVKTGWEGDAFTTLGGKDNAQHLNKFYRTYQTVSGLPHGVYAVSVKAFYRPGAINDAYTHYRNRDDIYNAATLFANTENTFNEVHLKCIFEGAQEKKQNKGTEVSYRDTEDGVTKYVPLNLVAAEYYMHELDLYDNTLVIGLYEDELTIGVDKTWVVISNDWSVFDDFRLTYYGTGDEAAQLWRDHVLVDCQAREFREKASPVVKERYQAAFEALRTAATYDEVKARVEALEKAYQAWWDNAGMWESLSNTLEQAETLANSGSFIDEACQTMLAVVAEVKAALAAMTMDNDELKPLYDRFWDAYHDMTNHPKDGADLTFMIKDPDFEDYSNYWGTSFTPSGNVGVAGTADNKCFEAWNCPNFDIFQYVYDLPLGVYEIQVQGFYRYLRDQSSWNAYTAQKINYVKPGGAPVYVYINDSKTPLMNIYDEKVPFGDIYITDPSLLYPDNLPPFVDGEGCWYPNEMYNSALAFSQGLYTQSAYGIVADPYEIVKVGVTGKTNQAGDSWAIWDNFKLIYHGFKADVVQPVLENTVTEAQKLTGELMGRSEHAALVKAIDDATQAVAAAQGEAMFNALAALYTAMAQATDSKDVFMEYEVDHDVNNLSQIISDYDQKLTSKVLLEKARELLQGIAGCTIYETSQVEQIRSDVNAMISDLLMTGVVYEQLGNALLQLSATLNTIDGAQNDDGLVIEARALYVDVLNNYTDGAYDRETAEEKLNEVTQMMTRLKEMYLGIGGILADDCKVEFFTTDGRRLEKAQKGIMVMKITRSDGTVTIRKITTE